MDPYIFEFAIDYNLLFEVLLTIVIMSFFIERGLSVIFESSLFIKWYEPEGEPEKKKKGVKEMLSVGVSIAAVVVWKLDAITILFKTYNEPQVFGYIITGLIIAGGSKASIKFFKDTLGFMSSAEKLRRDKKSEGQ
ncbi:MAG: hypothetical protein RLN81_15625 [Balneolaceae bacterium]